MLPVFFRNIVASMVEKAFPTSKYGRPRTCFDDIFTSILFILRTGTQWRMMPDHNVKWQTVPPALHLME